MKAFVLSHKKFCITLGIVFLLILGCLIWIEVRIGFNNLPLNKTSGTVISIYPSQTNNEPTQLLVKLDDPSSWPECEYAYVNCISKGIKEGDKLYILCSDWMLDSDPPGLSAYFMWKK